MNDVIQGRDVFKKTTPEVSKLYKNAKRLSITPGIHLVVEKLCFDCCWKSNAVKLLKPIIKYIEIQTNRKKC